MLARAGWALKYFLRCLVAENYHAMMIGEIAFVEVASVGNVELAHLPVRQINSADQD